MQGLLGVNIAEDLGGVEGSFLDEMIVSEELAYRWLDINCENIFFIENSFCYSPGYNIHSNIVMPYIEHYGTKQQQVKYCFHSHVLRHIVVRFGGFLNFFCGCPGILKACQDHYLPLMAAGECVASLAITEPDAGSDMQVRDL